MQRRELSVRVTPLVNWTKERGIYLPSRFSRRRFVRGTSGLFAAAVLPLGTIACSEEGEETAIRVTFLALKAALAVFALSSGVSGTGMFINRGGKDQTIELLLDLLGAATSSGERPVTDAAVAYPTIPSDGKEHVVEYQGLEPHETGEHVVEGQSVGTKRRTVTFNVA